MKIIENMNAQKLTEKKIASKLEFIKRYAARPSIREDAFGGKEKEKVAEAVQACIDLTKQHEELKRALDYTNLVTSVEVAGRQYTLHSLILHKRTLCRMKRQVWAALDDRQAIMEIEQIRGGETAEAWHDDGIRIAIGRTDPSALQDNTLPRRIRGVGGAVLDHERAGRARCSAQAAADASLGFEGNRPLASGENVGRTGFAAEPAGHAGAPDDQAGI